MSSRISTIFGAGMPRGVYPANGASTRIDLAGKQIGRWTVLHLSPRLDRHGAKWVCRCACGNISAVFGSSLRNPSGSRACKKCYLQKLTHGTAARKLMRQYMDNASDRGIGWELSEADFLRLTSSPCFYTGRNPEQIMTASGGEVYRYSGIDRLDSSKGYTVENSVPCCKDANYAKLNLSLDLFLQLVREIHEHMGGACQM